jgi:lipoate-protein ligase A
MAKGYVAPTWRFIRSGALPPAMNMAIDEAVMQSVGAGDAPPTLRFYGWNPPTLSIGYFQKAEEEVEFESLRRMGLGFVRRPTGGRAVLHDRELTYSMVVPDDYPGMSSSVSESCRVLSVGLLHGFRRLGLSAEMISLSTEEDKLKYASAGSAACFDSPSWHELVVEGRKVAGSAQTRQASAILQHGSILLDLDIEQLFAVLRFPSERVRDRLKAGFAGKAVAVNELCRALERSAVTLAQAEDAFAAGIAAGLGIELAERPLSDAERLAAERLAADKYGADGWNLRR